MKTIIDLGKRQKLRYLRALEANSMNKSQTARELGIARSTLDRYYKKYWDEYISDKESVINDSQNIEAKKALLKADVENITVRLQACFCSTLDVMDQRLQNKSESISNRDLIHFIGVLAPFVIEKKAVAGTRDNGQKGGVTFMEQHQTFAQRIVNHINSKSNKEGNE